MTITFSPKGVCSNKMTISQENGIITDVQIFGGCDGNLKGISSLLKGMKVEDAIERMSGIRCGFKSTSCPDQLAIALKQLSEQDN